jgi:hypothetical protein
MIRIKLLVLSVMVCFNLRAQEQNQTVPTQVMTLGVFHFAYPNLDVIKTSEDDQISILDEPYQSEIIAITKALEEFKPTRIAIEWLPERQEFCDSLFSLYRNGRFELRKSEAYQIGFRMGNNLNHEQIYCVDDMGRPYDNILEIFDDSIRLKKFEEYYLGRHEAIFKKYGLNIPTGKVTGIIDELIVLNHPERTRDRLAVYLLHPFGYEEVSGDFTGVDFETGRWFNRNLRIFRNIQRLQESDNERILVIIGAEHLNLLNIFFDISKEFDLVSPLPYLEEARRAMR